MYCELRLKTVGVEFESIDFSITTTDIYSLAIICCSREKNTGFITEVFALDCKFYNVKQPSWEGDIFGRLTPPPEYILEMEQSIFNTVHGAESDYICDQIAKDMDEEYSLLDLDFETIFSNEFDNYSFGPTLAELNDSRSRSPLINPEMKRLHQAAILTGDTYKFESELKTKGSSILEKQLKTQQKASVYHQQQYPNHCSANTAISSTVTRSPSLPIPMKGIKHTHTGCLSPTSPSDKKPLFQNRKFFDSFHQSKSFPQRIPQSEKNTEFATSLGRTATETVADCKNQAHQETCETSGSHEQVTRQQVFSNTYQSESEDDDDIDSETEDIEEEYCPFQKEGKIPARRKGRKSESEDMVPNPSKLLHIGKELDRLNKIISSLKPINEVPQQSRGRSRREKNKLASRYLTEP